MPKTLPHAGFADPLLQERSRRRTAYFKASLTSPLVLVGLLAGAGLYFLHPFAVPVAWLAIVVAALYFADRRASGEWWLLLLDHLGMHSTGDDVEALPLTPLLRSGDERKVLRSAADDRRQLLIFRSTEISRNSKGNETRTHHDYTAVLMRDAAARIRFLSAHEYRVSFMRFAGDDLRGKTLRDVEEFKVESVELNERFKLRSSTEDGQRARQIFKPSFIVWFTHSGVAFEYESGDLVVFVDRVLEHAEEFKLLLTRAEKIHSAMLGE